MGRAPCCEKMGVKRGTWTPEEDQILVTYIQRYGHGNWRALPKQAGLLRCGKSCRLRWTNYLRPDIKRGYFSREEEETIIKLHELLGNRWSAIAVRLPGRTDNEIKNVWHTHLKKRLKQNEASPYIKRSSSINVSIQQESIDCAQYVPVSPHQSSTITDISSSSTDFSTLTAANCTTAMKDEDDPLADIAESLWEVLSSEQDQGRMMDQFQANMELEFPPDNDDNMDFWLNLYFHEQLPELLEF